MTSVASYVFGSLHPGLTASALIVGIVAWLVCWTYLNRLRNELPEEWHRVGSPPSIWRALNSYAFAKSIWLHTEQFDHRGLMRLRRLIRGLWIVFWALLVVELVSRFVAG